MDGPSTNFSPKRNDVFLGQIFLLFEADNTQEEKAVDDVH